jgi:hypothetical protein
MHFNPNACTWEPVRIQAALNEGSEALEALLVLSPEFQGGGRSGHPNGFRGGLQSGVLRVVDKKLIEGGNGRSSTSRWPKCQHPWTACGWRQCSKTS